MVLVHMRISVSDRPGALGDVGALLGALGTDIASMRVLGRGTGRALDDLYLDIPERISIAAVSDALGSLPGVRLHGVRRGGHSPGAHPDLDLLGQIMDNPGRGLLTLTDMAPAVFSCDWAVLRTADQTLWIAGDAPDPLPAIRQVRHRVVRDEIGSMRLAVIPLFDGAVLLGVGRNDGPAFHPTEILHVNKVIELAVAAGLSLSTSHPAVHVRRTAATAGRR